MKPWIPRILYQPNPPPPRILRTTYPVFSDDCSPRIARVPGGSQNCSTCPKM